LYYLPDSPGNLFRHALPDRSRLRYDGQGGDVYALTADELRGLLEAEWIDRFLFQVLQEPSSEEIGSTVRRAVAVFMAAYGPLQD